MSHDISAYVVSPIVSALNLRMDRSPKVSRRFRFTFIRENENDVASGGSVLSRHEFRIPPRGFRRICTLIKVRSFPYLTPAHRLNVSEFLFIPVTNLYMAKYKSFQRAAFGKYHSLCRSYTH